MGLLLRFKDAISPSRPQSSQQSDYFSIAELDLRGLLLLDPKPLCKLSLDTAMASDDSSSSGVNAETRIGSLEAAMGQLRLKLDVNDKKIDVVSKAWEKSWDLLNTELRQLRDDLTGNLNDFKEETRTTFKDEANIHGDFGNRISALELEVAKLKSKIEK